MTWPPANVPTGIYPWSLSDRDHETRVDPVNLLIAFADLDEATLAFGMIGLIKVGKVERISDPQWFRDGSGTPRKEEASVATSREWLPPWRRTHARLFYAGNAYVDPDLGKYTGSTAHGDEIPLRQDRCHFKEVAWTFTAAREFIANRLDSRYRVGRIKTRNYGSVKQCDGRRVVADGWVVAIDAR